MVLLTLALRLEHRPSPMAAESAHGADEARSLDNDVFCGASPCSASTFVRRSKDAFFSLFYRMPGRHSRRSV